MTARPELAFDGAAREQKQRRRLTYKIRVILAKHDAKIEPRRARKIPLLFSPADKFRSTYTQTLIPKPFFMPLHIIQFACNSYRAECTTLNYKIHFKYVVIDFARCQRRNLCFRPARVANLFVLFHVHGWIK